MGQQRCDRLVIKHFDAEVLGKGAAEEVNHDAGVVHHLQSVDHGRNIPILPVVEDRLDGALSALEHGNEALMLLGDFFDYFVTVGLVVAATCELRVVHHEVFHVKADWLVLRCLDERGELGLHLGEAIVTGWGDDGLSSCF